MGGEDVRQFGTWDWVVFAVMLVISAGIGIFYAFIELRDAQKATTAEYLMGGRNMKLIPVSLSILVSYISSVLILGNSAEMYTAGTLFNLTLIGIIIAIILATVLFVPLLYPLKLTSSFEYLELRFNSKLAKLTGTIILIIQQTLYTGIASYAPSTALEAVTGFPTWATIITLIGVSTFYTFLGGLKAVVWTDAFQAMVMVAGLLAIVIHGSIQIGGFGEVWSINKEWGRINFWEPDPDPRVRHSAWTLIVGGAVLWLTAFGTAQPSVQRYSSLSTLRKSKTAVLLNIPGITILIVLTAMAGLVMFAFYAKKGCDPFSDKQVQNVNQLLPLFVMEVLGYPGLPGLFLACLFSGALSTVSSNLNSLSTVAWQDICKPLVGEKVSEKSKVWITRGLVILFGGAGVGIAFLAQQLGGTVLQISFSFNGAAAGPVMGLFILGGVFPWANWIGCIFGGIIGLALPLWIGMGSFTLPRPGYTLTFPTNNCTTGLTSLLSTTNSTIPTPVELSGVQNLYKLSYLWYTSVGFATAVIVGLVVSVATNPFIDREEVDSKYLIPFFDKLFCCLPGSCRRSCRCGYKYRDPEDICNEESTAAMNNVLDLEVGASSKRSSTTGPNVDSRDGIRTSHKVKTRSCDFHNVAFSNKAAKIGKDE